jgi:hypothetical protein
MSAIEYDDVEKLLAAHRARLFQLELKQATMGSGTPEHVPIEMERIAREIERLSGAAVEMTVREKYLIDQQWQMRYEVELIELKREVREMRVLIDRLLPHMATIAAFAARAPAWNGE